MRPTDVILAAFLMFLNMLVLVWLIFHKMTEQAYALVILFALNLLFLFAHDRKLWAAGFFAVAILNSLIMFISSSSLIAVVMLILNVLILYYFLTPAITFITHTAAREYLVNEPGLDVSLYYEDEDFFRPIRHVENEIEIGLRRQGK